MHLRICSTEPLLAYSRWTHGVEIDGSECAELACSMHVLLSISHDLRDSLKSSCNPIRLTSSRHLDYLKGKKMKSAKLNMHKSTVSVSLDLNSENMAGS